MDQRDRLLYDPSLVSFKHPLEGYKHLAVSVILLALYDAKRGDRQARKWLRSTGRYWCELADFDFDPIEQELRRRRGKLSLPTSLMINSTL